MHEMMRRRRARASAPGDVTLTPLGEARFARLAWVRPSRWQDVWRLESERGVHAERWPADFWKGELGVRFADPPELRIRWTWQGTPQLTAVGEDAPRLSHHPDWLGHAEWRRRGQPVLRWRRVSMTGHRLEDANGQPLLHLRQQHAGWFDWRYEVQLEDAVRRSPELPEWLAMAVHVATSGGHSSI